MACLRALAASIVHGPRWGKGQRHEGIKASRLSRKNCRVTLAVDHPISGPVVPEPQVRFRVQALFDVCLAKPKIKFNEDRIEGRINE